MAFGSDIDGRQLRGKSAVPRLSLVALCAPRPLMPSRSDRPRRDVHQALGGAVRHVEPHRRHGHFRHDGSSFPPPPLPLLSPAASPDATLSERAATPLPLRRDLRRHHHRPCVCSSTLPPHVTSALTTLPTPPPPQRPTASARGQSASAGRTARARSSRCTSAGGRARGCTTRALRVSLSLASWRRAAGARARVSVLLRRRSRGCLGRRPASLTSLLPLRGAASRTTSPPRSAGPCKPSSRR